MKLRRVSLINYIVFLVMLSYVWVSTLRRDESDTFNLQAEELLARLAVLAHPSIRLCFQVSDFEAWNRSAT